MTIGYVRILVHERGLHSATRPHNRHLDSTRREHRAGRYAPPTHGESYQKRHSRLDLTRREVRRGDVP